MTEKPGKTIHRQEIAQGRVFTYGREEVLLPSGVTTDLDIIRHPGAAAVIPHRDGQFALIRQYRHASGGYLWEIPAGCLEPNEQPLECAHREVKEEAGVAAGKMVDMGFAFMVPGYSDEVIHFFLATDLEDVPIQHDRDEVILSTDWFTRPEIEAMIQNGELTDGKTLVGLFRAFQTLAQS
ncbi:MAG: ADP-ribose pyrophosphatase [Myxococcales bacterium]|nr:ADP-ribose pyrophosphatase [Myxococcales bacterium]